MKTKLYEQIESKWKNYVSFNTKALNEDLLTEGYTLYWDMSRDFTDNEWNKIIQSTKKLLKTAEMHNIIIRGWDGSGSPKINNKEIKLNGDGDRGLDHESFILTKKIKRSMGSHYIKTNRKPYDAVVASILYMAKKIAPTAIKPSGDDGNSSIKMGGTNGWGK